MLLGFPKSESGAGLVVSEVRLSPRSSASSAAREVSLVLGVVGVESWCSVPGQPTTRFQLVASTSMPMAAIQLPATRTAMLIHPTLRRWM